MSEKVMRNLKSMVDINRKVDLLAGEVADASVQQSSGISQLRNAVFQMDKVTQDNAAAAEESASATRELRVQAKIVRDAVDDLQSLLESQERSAAKPIRRANRIVAKEEAFEAPRRGQSEVAFKDFDFN